MRMKIQNVLYWLRQIFGFLPALMAGTAFILSVATTALDKLFLSSDPSN